MRNIIKKHSAQFIVFAALMLGGCSASSVQEFAAVRPAETHAVDMRHEEIDKISVTKLNWIKEAEKSIDIEMWNMWKYDSGTVRDLYDELENACRRGVKVRIAVGAENRNNEHVDSGYFNCPDIAVINVEPAAHSKYMIVDNEKITIGSANWSWTSMEQNYEFNLNIENSDIAGSFTYLFEELWGASGAEVRGDSSYAETDTLTPLARGIHVPEEFKMIYDYQIEGIDNAQEELLISIYHYQPFFWEINERIHSRLSAAANRGVRLKFLIDQNSYSRVDKERIDELASQDNTYIKIIDMQEAPFHDASGVNHTKVLLVDGNRGIVSSMNWDRFTFGNSGRDAGVAFEDEKLYKLIEESFYRTWDSPYSVWADGQFPVMENKFSPPVILSLDAENITASSAEFKVKLADTGGSENAAAYFLWQETPVGNNWEYHFPVERFASGAEVNYKARELLPDTVYALIAQSTNESFRTRTPVIYFKTHPAE